MTGKFKNLSVEKDTKLWLSMEAKIDQIDVVYQKWSWDGIQAESIIFYNEDIAHLTEKQIIDEVAQCTALVKKDTEFTFKKGDQYTFVNFNFSSE